MWQEPLTHRAKKFRKKSSSLSLWCNNSRKERKSSSQSLGPCSLYAEVRPDYRAACVVCCCRNIWGSVQTYLSLMHHCDAARALQREQYGAASLTSASTRSYQAHNERLNDQTPFPPPGHSPMVLIQSCVSAFDAHSSPTQSRHCRPPPTPPPRPPHPHLSTLSLVLCARAHGSSVCLRVSVHPVCPSVWLWHVMDTHLCWDQSTSGDEMKTFDWLLWPWQINPPHGSYLLTTINALKSGDNLELIIYYNIGFWPDTRRRCQKTQTSEEQAKVKCKIQHKVKKILL